MESLVTISFRVDRDMKVDLLLPVIRTALVVGGETLSMNIQPWDPNEEIN